jgi:ketohexokinase
VEEITCDELVQIIGALDHLEQIRWIHFEGRIPDVLYVAIPQIRSIFPQATLSIEFEKPNRPGLIELLPFADVAFFSHSFFSKFQSEVTDLHHLSKTDSFFREMRKRNNKAAFVVTVGNRGAMYCTTEGQGAVPASSVEVVDATGAGDTFIAGFVWARGTLGMEIRESVGLAVALATNKVAQDGFDRVWESLGEMNTSRS